MADAAVSKTAEVYSSCGFDSLPRHQHYTRLHRKRKDARTRSVAAFR